jgi:hypothetical protein
MAIRKGIERKTCLYGRRDVLATTLAGDGEVKDAGFRPVPHPPNIGKQKENIWGTFGAMRLKCGIHNRP